jgi:hypothetical protein
MKPLIIAIFLISCADFSKHDGFSGGSFDKIMTGKIDTAITEVYRVTSTPGIFETAFFLGAKSKMDTFSISFYPVDIGQINIESGKVIACDPVMIHGVIPFVQTFPIGHFPVQLAIAKLNNDERVAFARILFSDKPPAKWEFAYEEGEKPIPIGGENFYGYGVDAGMGLFIDSIAAKSFNRLIRNDEHFLDNVFFAETNKHSHVTWDYCLYEFGDHNLATFSTGYGDGTYGTYVGYDDKGNICRLLTDFGLVEWWKK